MLANIIDVFRPKRWYRNVSMVFGTVIAVKVLHIPPGHLVQPPVLPAFLLAFVALCLVASGNYGINEILDAKSDSHHPQKKHRAIPSGRISVRLVMIISVICYAVGMTLVALTHNWALVGSVGLMIVSGIVYNVPPIRLKDRPYLDFTTEAINNPIRLMIGWYAVATATQLVPASFVLGYWFLGVFLMAAKRFGEIRLINDQTTAIKYRLSLGHYTEEHLLMAMIGGLAAFSYMLGALSFKYSVDIMLVLPFIIWWIMWFFAIAFEENTIVKDPERVFEKKGFLALTLVTLALFSFLFYSGDQILGWVK